MSPQEWISTIDKVTAACKAEFGNLSAVELNRKPNHQTWSVAQNLDHLIVINKTYYPVIASIRSGTYKIPFMGKVGFLVRFFGKSILKAVHPDRRKKIKTFPIWQPSTSEIEGNIVQRFVEHQEELKKLITSSQDLVDQEIVISSPANRNIVYKLSVAFDIIVTHELRHLEQARELLTLLNKK